MLDHLVLDCKGTHEKLAPMDIHEQIRDARVRKGWSMERLAAEISAAEGLEKPLSWQTVQQWEAGKSAPKRTRMKLVTQLLGFPADEVQLFNEQTEGGYSIPVMANTASMGPGAEQHDDVIAGRLTLSPTWISKTLKPLTTPENLRFIHGYGDSMAPTFIDGDILLVDTGAREVKVDGIYVLEANERLYIKRVRQRLDGAFEISSDNPTVKTVDVLDGSKPVNVLGRVVWLWNGHKV
jgi:phage repressor protein C with HTH and peptisase S24 domain